MAMLRLNRSSVDILLFSPAASSAGVFARALPFGPLIEGRLPLALRV